MFSLTQDRLICKGYSLPNPLVSYGEYQRLHGYDLPDMNDVKLYTEKIRAIIALANLDQNNPILLPVCPSKFIIVSNWFNSQHCNHSKS